MEALRLVLHEGRRRGGVGGPGSSGGGVGVAAVAAAMGMRAPGLGGMSVRETLDDWFYAAANAPVEEGLGVAEVAGGAIAAERDFLLAWVDAQNPQGLCADE